MERVTNKQFTDNPFFNECCLIMKIENTKRQASKFRNKKGLAYTKGVKAWREVKRNGSN